MQSLKLLYTKTIISNIMKQFDYKNINEVPKIEKIVINRGFDESCQSSKVLDVLLNELSVLSGQRPVLSRARKAIANFKIKENMPIGMFLTLRNDKMYGFLDRLINLSLPRIRDFQGVSKKGFDGFGNYNLGLTEQLMFPEIDFDKLIKIQGMNIAIVTTAKTDKEAFYLLKQFGMPFNE